MISAHATRFENLVLAKAVENFHLRSRMPYVKLAQYMGFTRQTLLRIRKATTRWAPTREFIFQRIATWHVENNVPFTLEPPAPFPPDPHGDHPECE